MFLWLLVAAWGMKGRVSVADTHKGNGLVCAGEHRLNGPAATITGGFLLQNHSHYCTNTHLGSSCRAAMDDHKAVSSRHSSRAAFQQTAVRPAPALARQPACVPPLKSTMSLDPQPNPRSSTLLYSLPTCIFRMSKSSLS